ncbi:hypothetical protein PHYBLDRAFT_144180 [Phycomyces blakesleeanus NRRL 1555(-)]|uniref:Homeodomain-like DNA binding domain-containing transcription factor n=1 Tax=Phycomyces blakesleeanus (strain ATCC 8743b / DSM 1359 / FGSC 10004 / NBRC 33097 / NRRL 1555) TaxID=763407 RepID=A0A163AP45_PHYB8|nr:hypothetical protein PHYBLDRAFT_144180 [Phycomyces blakesleeanus NRRL 1555(-)]OAD74821.1 hypothetical protein PHYBLDRAFT_144180 [Phycomyces blakesleeanus NRRL 1555(-)]|eukprot:XP_018292861.1 hypothetical protein PHYBLDRAFT_144180 [Phycomyces blakesleeanus NRRL 1555(-)]
MSTSNNSLEFVMDKHCEMVSHSRSADQTQFSGIAFDPLCNFNQEIVDKMHGEVVLRYVTDIFVNHANMEWTHTSAGNSAVMNLLSLRSFLPTEVNEATTKIIVAQKPKTNLLEKVGPDSVPTAESIGQDSYQKYNQNQVNKLFSLVFSENETAAATARETGINVQTAQNYVRLAREKIQANFDAATVETDESNGLETMEVEEVSVPKERKHGNQKLFQDSCHGRVLWAADYQISNLEALGEEVCSDNKEVREAA